MLVEGFGVSDSVGVAGIRTWVAGFRMSGYRDRVGLQGSSVELSQNQSSPLNTYSYVLSP